MEVSSCVPLTKCSAREPWYVLSSTVQVAQTTMSLSRISSGPMLSTPVFSLIQVLLDCLYCTLQVNSGCVTMLLTLAKHWTTATFTPSMLTVVRSAVTVTVWSTLKMAVTVMPEPVPAVEVVASAVLTLNTLAAMPLSV